MERLSLNASYYECLGLKSDCSASDVSKAYKKLAVKFHPDKNPDDKETAEANFKTICEAYEVLSDPEKRAKYDHEGRQGLNGDGEGSGGGWSRRRADDIFAQAFGESAQDVLNEIFARRNEGSTRDGMPRMFTGDGGMGSGGAPRGHSAKLAKDPSVVPAWTSITVRGLKGAAQHNGKVGQIESYDADAGRYAVRLANGEGVKIKFENVLQRLEADLMGEQSGTQAKLDGRRAIITGYDEAAGTYAADLRGGGRATLHPTNLIWPNGTRGKVVGLQSAGASKWNDRIGQVLDFDREAGRYLVQMSKDDQLRVRQPNFRL